MRRTIALFTLLFSLAVFGLGTANAANFENKFLDQLKKERVPVSIYLVNGIKLQGQIEDYSNDAILLKNAVSQMVYVHAISTVVPSRSVMTEEALY